MGCGGRGLTGHWEKARKPSASNEGETIHTNKIKTEFARSTKKI
jgi:hypothetical protein